MTYTAKSGGQECVGACGQQGEDYWWCKKSITDDDDDDWEYCSPDSTRTRYVTNIYINVGSKPCKLGEMGIPIQICLVRISCLFLLHVGPDLLVVPLTLPPPPKKKKTQQQKGNPKNQIFFMPERGATLQLS